MKKHPILWTLAAIVGVAIVISAYIVFGPHPTDFAGGKTVSLGEYHGADPTGVAAELKSASLVERGERHRPRQHQALSRHAVHQLYLYVRRRCARHQGVSIHTQAR